MSHVDRIHPNVALATAVGIYSLLFRLVNPPDSTASRFMKSREAISVIHCILTLCAISFELYRQRDKWIPPSFRPNPRTDVAAISEGQGHARTIHMIEASPPFTNAIISYECGYLIQDFVVLVMGARRVAIDKRARSVMARNINWRILGWHHLGIASALGLFHFRALEGRAKGSLVIMMMLLMNASTPMGTLHWFLTRFHPSWRASICATYGLYLLHYALARVYLLYYIVKLYGAWIGKSAFEAFAQLPLQCQMGTWVIGSANAFWLLIGMRKFARKYL